MHVPTIVWVALALLAARVLLRPVLALVYGKQIGERVLAKQPDAISLKSASASAALKPELIESEAQVLMPEGFADAGWFTAPELPEFTMRMLACEADGLLCVLYEHKRAGHWVEINCRYPDGTRTSWNNMRGTGLSNLPNVTVTHMPGASAAAVLRAARAGRAKSELTPLGVSPTEAPRIFEQGYAQLVAARKEHGISRTEVAKVSLRPKLAKNRRVA